MKYLLVCLVVLCFLKDVITAFKVTTEILGENSTLFDKELVEGEHLTLRINIFPENVNESVDNGNYELSVKPQNGRIADVNPLLLYLTGEEILTNNFTFDVKGLVLGRTKLMITLLNGTSDNDTEVIVLNEQQYDLRVVQSKSVLQFYFTLLVGIFVSFNNVNMGCTLDLQLIKKVLKRPIAPAIGFASQFLFMPIMSMQIGKLLFAHQPSWRLGLFVFGCCPGGALSNFWTLLFEGDLDLSVTMTFISDCAALGMMPFWLFVFGSEITKGSNLQIPYVNMIISLLCLTSSLGLGLLIQHYKPTWAKKLVPLIRPLAIILIFIFIFGGIYVNSFIFRVFEWSIMFAGLAVAWGGYCFGAVMAAIARLSCPQIIAVSIETAFQNPGVAYVLLHSSLAQPDADLAAVPIVGQLVATGPPLWVIITIFYLVKRKLRNMKEVETDREKCENDKFIDEKLKNGNN